MPTHTTLEPVEATAKALDALVSAIEGAPSSGAVAAYRAAITRRGRNMIEASGPDALGEARERAAALSPRAAQDRREIVAPAWIGLKVKPRSPTKDDLPAASTLHLQRENAKPAMCCDAAHI